MILELVPSARHRTFLVSQAGQIADWLVDSGLVAAAQERESKAEPAAVWAERFPPGDPRRDVHPLPADPARRWQWLVSEMDAARGWHGASSPSQPPPAERGRPFRLGRSNRSTRQPGAATNRWRDAPRDASGPATPDASHTHPDDIPDPHVLGTQLHALAYEQITSSTDALVRVLQEVASQPG